jgi:hypothetical protein
MSRRLPTKTKRCPSFGFRLRTCSTIVRSPSTPLRISTSPSQSRCAHLVEAPTTQTPSRRATPRANASSSKPRPTFTMCPLRRYTATGSPRFGAAGSVTCTGSNANGAGDWTSGVVVVPSSFAFHQRTRCGVSLRSLANFSRVKPLLRHALRTPRASCSDHCPRCAMPARTIAQARSRRQDRSPYGYGWAASSSVATLPTSRSSRVRRENARPI